MSKYHNIAVMGKSHDISGFKAAGLDVFPVEGEKEARALLMRLAGKGYAVIFIAEDIAEQIKKRRRGF